LDSQIPALWNFLAKFSVDFKLKDILAVFQGFSGKFSIHLGKF
jgi:hypothetical protein